MRISNMFRYKQVESSTQRRIIVALCYLVTLVFIAGFIFGCVITQGALAAILLFVAIGGFILYLIWCAVEIRVPRDWGGKGDDR